MENGNSENVILKKTVDFFSSLKTAIFMMIILAVVSIAGTLVPQLKEEMFYISEYGPNAFKMFKMFGLTDLYHSWFFVLLLFLLNVNILVCSFKRLKGKLKILKSDDKRGVNDKLIKAMKNNARLLFPGTLLKAKEGVLKVLGSNRFKVEEAGSEKKISIKASKGIIGQFGSDIVHLSILIIILGAMIGSIFGFKDFITINEGETQNISRGGFDLRLDRFHIDIYESSGAPKDYFSALTVLENRKEILKKTIEVNDPLRYKGIWFYQSSYGQSWSAIKGATFKVEDRQNKNKKKGKEVTFDFNKDFALPEWGLKVKMVDFVADFIYDTSAKKVFSRSAEHKNPAVLLEIYENGKLISKPWIFLNFPDAQFMKKKDSRYFFQLLNYNPVSYTGLQVTKDPGVNIVLVGFSLLTLGMILAFVVSHKKLWVSLEERDGKVIILTGGSVNKNDLGFEREFAGLTEDIEKQLKGNN